MTELPKKIIVNRIPYSVCNSNDPYSYEADPGVQEIRVTQEAASARKRQYFMWEVAHLLLVSAGMPQKEADRYHAGVGSVLNRLVIDNDTDFVKGRKPVPSMIWINGLPYTIQQGIFKELQDEDLGGRVTYDTLYIQIIMTGGVPYSLTVPSLPARDSMTDEQFNIMMEKGYHQAKSGEGLSVDEAFTKIREGI